MISDEELSELPADPELAFVRFEQILRDRIHQIEEQEAASEGTFDADPFRLEYMNKVHAAAKVYEIGALADLKVPRDDRSGIGPEYRRFTRDVDHVTVQIRLHMARGDRQGSVGLDDITRTKIHHFISRIREAITRADLPDDKRDSLLNKLNKFASEVDRKRTGLQTAMSIYIGVCDGIGQGFTKLKPVREMIDSVAALLGHAKENEERAEPRIPSSTDRKRIETPRKSLPPTRSERMPDAVDDDVPF